MKTSEIRKLFLDYFKGKGHTVVKSDSLIPKNDPTLLFTGAGMNQFKDYFLGLRTDLKRATSSQKCLRTGDLDNVGKTPYHHSFFEMLGNFSFGDYFKKEAIEYAWEFLTDVLSIPKERLQVSVHEKDEEAVKIWRDHIKIPQECIHSYGDKLNFWPANAPKDGPNGPCGPCSEIYYDFKPEKGPGGNIQSDRFAEIWNMVFTQFERQDEGKLIPLKAKNIDTGMGLERLACVVQHKESNFEIDIFEEINKKVKFSLGFGEKTVLPTKHIYAISDHVRAVTFAIVDGVIPSNEGRGYVIRKLIRRALWQAHELLNLPSMVPNKNLSKPFLYRVVPDVVEVMKDQYPELENAGTSIGATVRSEEERFINTLQGGLKILENRLSSAKNKTLSGDVVFELYDTYGFPDELTRTIAGKSGIKIDEKGFSTLLEEQRTRAKASSKLADTIFAASDINQDLVKLTETEFLGYKTLEAEGKILWSNFSGQEGAVVLDKTPFYPEGGGQVGDSGILENQNFKFTVLDTQKKEKVTLHIGKLEKGTIKIGERCTASVNKELREATKRNHTATHLLQAALRTVLGTHVRQVGSLVNPEKLRFDYTHGKAMTSDEIKQVEKWVNETVLESIHVESKHLSYAEAMKSGTLAFFGDKYGDEVRVIDVPGRSRELCGGTHCHQTGEIGAFVIVSETSIGSGTRRIEALTGLNAVNYTKALEQKISQISSALKVNPDQILDRIEKLQQRVKDLEKGSEKVKSQAVNIDELIASGTAVGKIKLIGRSIPDLDLDSLRRVADELRSKASQSVIVLFSSIDSKVNMIVALSKDLSSGPIDAKNLAQSAAKLIDGSAGGRKDLAQGGGRNPKGIDSAISEITNLIRGARF